MCVREEGARVTLQIRLSCIILAASGLQHEINAKLSVCVDEGASQAD